MTGSHNDRADIGDGPSRPRAPSRGSSSGGGEAPPRYLPRFFVESSQLFESALPPPPSSAFTLGQEFVLGPEDAHHALRVLRLVVGDECEVVVIPSDIDGKDTAVPRGAAYLAAVTSVKEEVRVRLAAQLKGRQAGANYLNAIGLVQAVTRPSAMDYLLEKGTEVGASFFLVLPTTGSVSRSRSPEDARLDRWRRIALESSKQSKQLAIPSVEMADSVDEALTRLGEETLSLVLEPAAPDGLYGLLSPRRGAGAASEEQRPAARPIRLALWVGPESGWSGGELAALRVAGAATVRLGQSVLRAENAGPVAVAVARLALGDW